MNRPIILTDPTGHAAIGDSDGSGCEDVSQCKKNYLSSHASRIVKSLEKKNKRDRDDFEAMIDIVNLGASLFDTNDELIPALSGIFLGIEESNSLTVWNAYKHADPCAAVGRSVEDCAANKEKGSFGDAGFQEDFQDGQSQPITFGPIWLPLQTHKVKVLQAMRREGSLVLALMLTMK